MNNSNFWLHIFKTSFEVSAFISHTNLPCDHLAFVFIVIEVVQDVCQILDNEFSNFYPSFFCLSPTLSQNLFTFSLLSILFKSGNFEIYLNFDTFYFNFLFFPEFPELLSEFLFPDLDILF